MAAMGQKQTLDPRLIRNYARKNSVRTGNRLTPVTIFDSVSHRGLLIGQEGTHVHCRLDYGTLSPQAAVRPFALVPQGPRTAGRDLHRLK
jgi:hypothetical protein